MQQYIEFASLHPILVVAWFGLVFAVIYVTIRAKFSAIKTVSAQEVALLINKENGQVVDIRSQDKFRKAHILGAKSLPVSQINANNVTDIEKYKQTPIIVVCDNGMAASGAAGKLNKTGFEQVYILSGGMASWQDAGMPVSKK